MKTFEEKWTAWIDGELDGRELAEFEAALPDKAAAEVEKAEALQLGVLLKEQLAGRALSNEEFFGHQLRERIAREDATEDEHDMEHVSSTWWTIRRLFWAGATSVAIFIVCAVLVMRETKVGGQSSYTTQILNARVDPAVSPNATISIFDTQEDKVTVIWVEGLQSLPAEYATK